MPARQKLNHIYLTGVLAIALILGLSTGSTELFVAVAVLLTVLRIHSGDIRLEGRKRDHHRRRRR